MKDLQSVFNERNKKVNKIEKIKNSKDVNLVIKNLQDICSNGYENLDNDDAKYFLKCYGIYDKGDDTFMIRVRVPAGRLTFSQAQTIGKMALLYGDDYIDITTRQQIELRYIKIENLYTILEKLNDVGITTYQTGVDNLRNIVTDPLDGISFDNIIDTYPIVEKLQNIFLKNTKYISSLPRKFNTAILGSSTNSCNIFGHDCCFALASKDGEFGFNVYLGGKVGIQATNANIFVTLDTIELFFKTLLDIFKEFGFRDNRNKNRLYFLIKAIGIEQFIKELKQKANFEFETSGINLVDSKGLNTNYKIIQKNNNIAQKVVIPAGITSGSDMIEFANCANKYGSGDLRLSYDQNIYIINIQKDIYQTFLNDDIIKKYSQYQNIYFEDMIACAGIQTCSFAVIPNKQDAIQMAQYLNNEVSLLDAKIRMNWSACIKGCGVHGIADIGFEGCKAKDKNGETCDGVNIFLGGKITHSAKEGYKFIKSVPISIAKYYIKYLLNAYSLLKNKNESFENFDTRVLQQYSHQSLIFYCMINFVLEQNNLIPFQLSNTTKTGRNESFEIFDFGIKLYRNLTNKSRYTIIDDFTPQFDNKIDKNDILATNKDVPNFLNNIIYKMTIFDKNSRYKVFSEIIEELKEYMYE